MHHFTSMTITDDRQTNWQVDVEEKEMLKPPPSEEDGSEIKQIFETQETQDKEEKGEDNGEGLQDDLEGYFLKGRTQQVIPAGYESASDGSFISDNIRAEGCC